MNMYIPYIYCLKNNKNKTSNHALTSQFKKHRPKSILPSIGTEDHIVILNKMQFISFA